MEIEKSPVPVPNDPKNMLDQFLNLYKIVAILREKCPWDSVQTNQSIAILSIEEVYEMVEAIDKQDDKEFSKELGDLLLHIILHTIMAEERGAFDMIDVLTQIQTKLVYRHPHVFGDVEVSGENEVLENWEDLKMSEGQKSILEGVPKSLPALLRAERVQYKASKVGFDWEKKEDVWAKVEEELGEFKQEVESGNQEKAKEELGDVIFSIVNVARLYDLIPEESLQKTNDKFTKRFQYIEDNARESGKKLREMTLEEMDKLWEEAKNI